MYGLYESLVFDKTTPNGFMDIFVKGITTDKWCIGDALGLEKKALIKLDSHLIPEIVMNFNLTDSGKNYIEGKLTQ